MKIRNNHYLIHALVSVLFLLAFSSRGHAGETDILQIIYPGDGSEIRNNQPSIGVDMSLLNPAADLKSVKIAFNGADVTDSAEITPAYIIYQPPAPLPSGKYVATASAKDTAGKDIQPLSWTFTIKDGVAVIKKKSQIGASVALSVSTDYISARYTPISNYDISRSFQEKEGMKLNYDLSFNDTTPARTVLGWLHRETQNYSDIEIDMGAIDYIAPEVNASMGYFRMKLSNLTVLGTELAGARVDKNYGPWDITLFSGRTQDPSTSGAYKQTSSGLMGKYAWGSRNTSALTALTASENNPGTAAFSSLPPADDKIISFLHEYQNKNRFKASLELARDDRREKGAASTHDGAARFTAASTLGRAHGELYAYDIGDNFYPVAEGSYKFLENDREGGGAKGIWSPTDHISLGGEYEQYDTNSAGLTTKRGNAFTAVSYGCVKSLRYQKSKLATPSTSSDTDLVVLTASFEPFSVFKATAFTAGWQDSDYSTENIFSDTQRTFITFNTSVMDRLDASLSYGDGNTDSLYLASPSTVDSEDFSFGLAWHVIPATLTWTGRYVNNENSGTYTDSDEQRYMTGFSYFTGNGKTLKLDLESVDYGDNLSPIYNYNQNIIRTGMDWNF